jgi:hypothetical protein
LTVALATAYVRRSRFDNKNTHDHSFELHLPHPTPETPPHISTNSEHQYSKMVATRRGAKKAPESAPATSTLNAPPKRGGRKKAVVEEAAPEPAPANTKAPKKTTTTKRKAEAEPEEAKQPPAKKPTMNTKATRAAKVETKAEPAPPAPKRATRAKKVAEPEAVEQPVAVVEEAPKPTATRGRKAAVKKAPAPKIEEPVIAAEPAIVEEPIVEEAPKPATRGRKAPAKKAVAAKPVKAAVVEEPVVEAEKPAPRARKAAAPKPSLPPPVAASRPTRGRAAAVAPPAQDSPLKAPARKPAKKAITGAAKLAPVPVLKAMPRVLEAPEPTAPIEEAAVVEEEPVMVEEEPVVVEEAEPTPAPVEEPFTEFPSYPTTPAHIAAPLTSRRAMAELPNYPKTPAHIKAPMATKDALKELPGYPKTPAHIVAPMPTKAALAELPGYPTTPAQIKAPIAVKAAMAERPEHPKTPAHISSPVLPMVAENEEVKEDLVEYVNTPVHVDASSAEDIEMEDAPEDIDMGELPDYPETPAHIQAPLAAKDALKELPGYPTTPAHIKAPMSARKALAELPIDYPRTPAHIAAAISTPPTMGLENLPADCSATPAHISSPVIAEEGAIELSEGPHTPQQLSWGVTNQEAFGELPEYPKTPSHIPAPMSNRKALAELPSYPATPAQMLEAAVQEEISRSVKKQTPSPIRFAGMKPVSAMKPLSAMKPSSAIRPVSFVEEVSEISETSDVSELSNFTECDPLELAAEVQAAQPKLQFASIQLSAPSAPLEPASPLKSALRSPQKFEAKTPKKAVTWDQHEESELFMFDGPLQGLTFFVDVTSHGKEHNYVFASLLEDLGAKVAKEWSPAGISHVLFKDGSISTLENVIASKGAVKCVNVGWVLECEENKKRVNESPYLVDLSVAMPKSPTPTAAALNPYTPARTPSRYALPPSSECRSIPDTPTSSEFDRSMTVDDDKENSELGIFFKDSLKGTAPRTCPAKKSSSVLFGRSPMKTPSKLNFLANTPLKQGRIQPFSTGKKRTLDAGASSLSLSAPPKKLRLF